MFKFLCAIHHITSQISSNELHAFFADSEDMIPAAKGVKP
jgi:hypothetical protein